MDGRMERTRGRPLPSGQIRPRLALLFSLTLISTGISVFLTDGQVLTAALGAGAVIWYNGVYTGLKRTSAFAAIPGALVGAAAPAMGWASGGGSLGDQRLAALCFFFFMWQVPHFWLLLLERGRDYERAGLPSVSAILTRDQLARMTSQWMFAAGTSGLIIVLYGLVSSTVVRFALLGTTLWIGWQGLIVAKQRCSYGTFRNINHYMMTVLVLLAWEGLRIPAQIDSLIRVYLS